MTIKCEKTADVDNNNIQTSQRHSRRHNLITPAGPAPHSDHKIFPNTLAKYCQLLLALPYNSILRQNSSIGLINAAGNALMMKNCRKCLKFVVSLGFNDDLVGVR